MTHATEVAGATERADRFAAAKAVADATLYEGYVLYPYRASAVKNQMRWQFGVLAPRAWAEADGSERWTSRTECLVVAGAALRLTVRVRFLQILHRTIEAATEGGGFAPVTGLEVGTTRWVPWDEAVERVVDVAPVALAPVGDVGHGQPFTVEAGASFETIVTPDGDVAGRVVRRWETLTGTVLVDATAARGPLPLARVAVVVENDARWAGRGRRATRPWLVRSSASTRCSASTTGSSCRSSTPRRGPRRRPPGATTSARSRCWSPIRPAGPTSSSRPRSRSTTIPRWPRRARATCTTRRRSTRSSPCGSSP